MLPDTSKRVTYLYLQLTVAFSAVVWTFIIWSGHLDMGFGLMIPAIMWCPGLAAFVTYRKVDWDFGSLGWCWPKTRYVVAAYCVPLAYSSIAYGAVWFWHLGGWNSDFVSQVSQGFGLHGLPAWGSLTLYIITMGTGGMILNLSTALGEEIGWRGLLVPELAKRMSFTKVGLLSGTIWAAWHVPLPLFADYHAGTNRWYALACSAVSVVSASIILAWLRLKSHSVWAPALFHASHNVFVPCVFDNLIRNTGSTLWYTTEFGAAVAITSTVFALYFWTRRSEVETRSTDSMHVVFTPQLVGDP
jgi:membrane protease YdiL (CAAX protease family)